MKLVLAAAALALLLFSPDSAIACSCVGSPTPCGSYEAADAVLVGTVLRVENTFAKDTNGTQYIQGQLAHVQVEETFKGAGMPEMIFRSYGTSCDPQYGAGQRWLFYAFRRADDNTWSTAACDRSVQLAWAADDLLYLRGLPQSAQQTRIAGQLRNRDHTPLVGVRVKLVGSFLTQEVFTDKNGVYEAYGLPPGKYFIEPDKPLNLKLRFSYGLRATRDRELRGREVELTEKSCLIVNFDYTENTLLRGRVFGPDGQPMRNICVQLVFKDNAKDTPHLRDCTDANGRFKIDDIPLGEYLLVANERDVTNTDEPFPTTYYPGVFEKDKATPLRFSSGDKLEDFDIHIPRKPLAVR